MRRFVVPMLVLLSGIGAVLLWRGQPDAASPPADARSDATTVDTDAAGDVPTDAAPISEQKALLSDPRVRAWRGRREFRERLRRFFDSADRLPLVRRGEEARTLRTQVQRRERAGELSAAEALLLEVGLIQAVAADENEQRALAMVAADRYRQRSEQRAEAWAAQPKPQFDAYKRHEMEIVREVAQMRSIPDGLSRDEYLRRRLQQARERIYASHE